MALIQFGGEVSGCVCVFVCKCVYVDACECGLVSICVPTSVCTCVSKSRCECVIGRGGSPYFYLSSVDTQQRTTAEAGTRECRDGRGREGGKVVVGD